MNDMPSTKDNRFLVAFPILFVLYIFLGLSDYGTDNDTYGMIRTGRDVILKGIYVPSREPGYLIPEMMIGGASLLGGFYLSNGISALLGTATLFLFWRLLKKGFSDSDAMLITLVVGLNPNYVVAASSSMDFVYSLFFGLVGISLLETRKPFWAAPAFSFAICSRLSNSLIIGVVYAYFLYLLIKENDIGGLIRYFLSGVLALAITILLFLPCFIAASYSFSFLTYYIGSWTFFGHLSRFVYKNVYLFGLLPFLFLVGFVVWRMFQLRFRLPLRPITVAAFAMVFIHEGLFFKVPLDISYRLPLIFVIVPLWIFVCRPPRLALYGLLGLTILYGFVVNLDILDRKYNAEGTEAIAADVGLFVRRGSIVSDVFQRPETHKYYFKLYKIESQ